MCRFGTLGSVDINQFFTYPTRKTIPGSKPFDVKDFKVQEFLCTADLHGTVLVLLRSLCPRTFENIS